MATPVRANPGQFVGPISPSSDGGDQGSYPAELTREQVEWLKERAAKTRQRWEEHEANFPAGPGTKPIEPQKKDAGVATAKDETGSGGGGGIPPGIDPIIRGLLVRLPKSGDVWPEADRKLWLQLLEGSFKLIYKDQAFPRRSGGLQIP